MEYDITSNTLDKVIEEFDKLVIKNKEEIILKYNVIKYKNVDNRARPNKLNYSSK